MTTEIEKLERRWQENPLGLTFAPLAEAYRKAGEISKALELLDAGLAQHPGYVPAHIVRGRCHLDAGEQALAELDFLCVVELDPENVIALQGLADVAEGEGRVSDAIRRLDSLLEVDRNNQDAQAQLDRLRVESAVAPLSSPELRIRNDSETLRPSEEPLSGIEILDIEANLPEIGADGGRQEMLEVPPEAAPAPPLSSPAPPVEAPVPAAVREEPSLEPESVPGLEEAPEIELEAPALSEPELVVTETMADIFLRQGHRELALAVYSQLLQRDPDNGRIAAAVAELTQRLAPIAEPEVPPSPSPAAPVAEPAPPPAAVEPVRRYAASDTGGRPVSEYLGGLLAASRPAAMPAVHPPAFEVKATTPAGDSGSGGPSFDEFFAPPAGLAEKPRVPALDTGPPESPREQDEEDLAQFNAWLRGLRG